MVKTLKEDSANHINTDDGKTKAVSDCVFQKVSGSKEVTIKSRLRFSGFSKKSTVNSYPVSHALSSSDNNAITGIPYSYFKVADTMLQQSVSVPEKDGALSHYESFCSRKTQLSQIVNEASSTIQSLNLESFTKKLQEISNRISNETFKIQIVGTFKNGKSTFINSFLGREILPAYALPCTAVINEVKYAEKKRAILHFKNPIPKVLPQELSPVALSHIKKHNSKNVPPIEIPYDKIEDFVVIPMGKDPRDMLLESPYEKVELFWPLEILKNGIEIIDSPGLNEHATRTKVTMDFLSKADAIIFVLNATALCSMEEMTFIEQNLKEHGFEDLFFVVNRFDMIPDNEKERIKKYAVIKLSALTNFGEKGIFFVSARNALDGKIASDKRKLAESALPYFEKCLAKYLVKRRGVAKLLPSAVSLGKFLKNDVLKKVIPRQNDMLETSADEFKEAYQNTKPKLNALQKKRDIVHERLKSLVEQCSYDFRQTVNEGISKIIDSTPQWIEESNCSVKLGLFSGKSKIRAAAQEIMEYTSEKFEQSISEWSSTQLKTAIQQQASKIKDSVNEEIQFIMKEVHVAGEAFSKSGQNNPGLSEPELQFSELFNDNQSISAAVTTISRKVSGNSILVMLSLVNGILALIVALILSPGKKSEAAMLKNLKDSLSKELVSDLRSSSEEFISSIVSEVTDYFNRISEAMLTPLDEEIELVNIQLSSVAADVEKSESEKKKKKEELVKIKNKTEHLCVSLSKFINDLKSI